MLVAVRWHANGAGAGRAGGPGRAVAAAAALCLAGIAMGCAPPQGPAPSRDRIRQPSGLATLAEGTVLAVSGGNWDFREADGTLMLIDVERLLEEASQAEAGDALSQSTPCRLRDDGVDCLGAPFIDPETTVRPGSGIGDIAVDRPAGEQGPARLLVPVRDPRAIVWLDVVGDAGTVTLDCGQDDEGHCDDAHRITTNAEDEGESLPQEPARVFIDDQGFRFGYVPHLLGGSVSLLALDGDAGPELADVEGDFFREDPFDDEELRGGFAIAQRPCDPAAPAVQTRDCTRPYLYGSHRYFPGVRQFTVAPGLDLILPGGEVSLPTLNAAVVRGRPFMAELAFEDDTGDTLLLVQTTPPGLLRVDTSLDERGRAVNDLLGIVPLCDDPNALALHRPDGGEPLALVACRADASLAVVGLGAFRLLRIVEVGAGPSDVVVDATGGYAYVANTEDDTISIVGVDNTRADFLSVVARIVP